MQSRLPPTVSAPSYDGLPAGFPRPYRPVFISFEGIDGSGKSTQARLLADALRQQGHVVVEVREPGGTDVGEAVRALLLDPSVHIVPRAELLLFSAARAQLVSTVIRPALAEGAVVIADRFFDSSTAYQGGGRQIESADWLEAHHRFVTNDLAPDRTYFVDVPLAEAASRRGGRAEDRMEQGGTGYFERIRTAYQSLARRHPDRIVTLDGTLPTETVHQLIWNEVTARRLTAQNNESPATRSE